MKFPFQVSQGDSAFEVMTEDTL